jgi:subtilisin family serine protease
VQRRRLWALLPAAAAGLLLALGGTAGAAVPKQPSDDRARKNIAIADPSARFVPGELLVRFRDGVSPAARAAALEQHGAKPKRDLLMPGVVLAGLSSGRNLDTTIAALSRRPDVLYAEKNWIYRPTAVPNDPRYTANELWGLNDPQDNDIDAPEAWDVTTGSANVVVAVVDTGVAYDHPDLSPNIWANPGEIVDGADNDGNGKIDDIRGWDFFDEDTNPRDLDGHGTHVAGTIGAKGNNAIGVTGVNWNVTLMPVRVLGPGGGTNEMVTNGFLYASSEGARVVNASLGCQGCFSQLMKDAIDGSSNTLFVVAAGNAGTNNESSPHYPCNYTSTNLVCVAATTDTDALASFSNRGTTSVDLGAPGQNITSTWLGFENVFSEDFEVNLASWTTGGTNNTWARTNEAAAGSSWSATDSPGALYQANTASWMQKASAVSFVGRSNCLLGYDLRIQVGDFFDLDTLYVEASRDGGATWETVDFWWGDSATQFEALESDMTSFDGSSSVLIRFLLSTDNEAPLQAQGVHVDNVRARCTAATYDADDYFAISGTSMATPHVAGVAALAWAKNPTVSVAQVKTALLNGGDALAVLSGNTVTGRRLNANGTLALIPPPPTFSDVPSSHQFAGHIEQMFARGITTGCFFDPGTGERRYCPLNLVTRQEMAVFLIRALEQPLLTPVTPTFSDVPSSHPFYGHIERFYQLGITTGCFFNPTTGERRYCPLDNVTREAMAAFVVRAKALSLLNPATPTFSDVPATNPFFGHIERFFEQGITTGCFFNPTSGERRFCPLDNVTREAMAAFVIRAFPSP